MRVDYLLAFNLRQAIRANTPMWQDLLLCCCSECNRTQNEEGTDRIFQCESCHRIVPWCFGGDNDDLCNDCWAELHKDDVEETPPELKTKIRRLSEAIKGVEHG